MTKVWIFLAVVSLALPFLLKVILQAVIAPIRIRHNQTMSARFDYEETRAEILTPEFQDFIGRTIRQFSDLGFAVAANVSRAGVVTGHSAIQILLVNRTTNDVAIVAIAYS